MADKKNVKAKGESGAPTSYERDVVVKIINSVLEKVQGSGSAKTEVVFKEIQDQCK